MRCIVNNQTALNEYNEYLKHPKIDKPWKIKVSPVPCVDSREEKVQTVCRCHGAKEL